MEVTFKPVGVVRTQATDEEVKAQNHKIQGELEIYPEFAAALDSIEEYSHLFILCYFHQLRPEQIGPLQAEAAVYLAPQAMEPFEEADQAGRRAGNQPGLEIRQWEKQP